MLGNLPKVHDSLRDGKPVDLDVPFARYELDSWILPESEGKRAFSLIRFVL